MGVFMSWRHFVASLSGYEHSNDPFLQYCVITCVSTRLAYMISAEVIGTLNAGPVCIGDVSLVITVDITVTS